MFMYIKTDNMSNKINNEHRSVSNQMQKTIERLSTGLRINRAGDDSAGLQISERMKSKARELNVVKRNQEDFKNLLSTADSSLQQGLGIVQRMRELKIQYQNSTYNTNDKLSMEAEWKELVSEFNRTFDKTTFNDMHLFNQNKAVDFNTIPSLLKINSIDTTAFQNDFTIDTWVKFDNVNKGTGDNGIFSVGNGTNNNGMHIGERGGKLYFGFYANDVRGTTNIEENKWYHLAFVYESGQKKIYIDGEEESIVNVHPQGPFTGTVPSGSIGNYYNSPYPGHTLNGSVDELRVWEKALSQDEVIEYAYDRENADGVKYNFQLNDQTLDKVYDTQNNLEGQLFNVSQLSLDGKGSMFKGRIDDSKNTTGISIKNAHMSIFGLDGNSLSDDNGIEKLDSAIDYISSSLSEIGTQMNRIGFKEQNTETKKINTEAAKQRILDSNVSEVSSELVKQELKLSSTSMMLMKNNSYREQIFTTLVS